MEVVRTELLAFLQSAKNQINGSTDADQAADSLQSLHEALQENKPWQRYFNERLFIEFSQYLLRCVTVRWPDELHGKLHDCIDVFFINSPADDSFLVLTKSLSSDSHTVEIRTAVRLLEKWLLKGRVSELIRGKTSRIDEDGRKRVNVNVVGDKLVTRLVALPDLVANQTSVQERSVLTREKYYKLLSESMLDVLQFTYDNLKNGQDCNLSFVNALFGKACVQGHADTLMTVLLPAFSSSTQSDPLWCRICQRFLTAIPDHYVESVLVSLLTRIEPSFGEKCVVSRLLGDAVLTNAKVKFLITHKFILVRFYSKVSVLLIIIFYLASSDSRRQLMIDTLMKVMDVWGDASALNHTSHEQHLYITQAVIIMAHQMTQQDIKQHRQALLLKLIHGVQSHLQCSVDKMRCLGMVVGECLTKRFDPSGKKLEFEYEMDDDVKLLKVLCGSREELKKWFSSQSSGEGIVSATDTDKREVKSEDKKSTLKTTETNGDEDSDDDLQPYAMPDESQEIRRKAPVYLRDVMAGLLCQDDRDRAEACLLVAESVICSQPDNLDEVVAELVKILLHLQDAYSLDDFVLLRHRAMTAAAVRCPRQVVPYLTSQFYEQNYNLRQRMDMLEVLSSAALELSEPRSKEGKKQTLPVTPLIRECREEVDSGTENWKEIVRKRIEGKTRRFTKGPSKAPPQPVANQFGPVAGLFFYPLLEKYDSCCATMNMMGEDHLVLGRLISTLAVIMHAAANTPAARQMAVALMEFVWALRYHIERFVRHSLLHAICMVMCSLPPAILLSDLQAEIIETHLLCHDYDAKTQELALQTAALLESVLKEAISIKS